MGNLPPLRAYSGWSAAEIAADQALAASIHALSQADGLLSPALDALFARRPRKPAPQNRPSQDAAAPNLKSTTPCAGISRTSLSCAGSRSTARQTSRSV